MAPKQTEASQIARSAETVEQRFRCLAEMWHGAVAYHSSSTKRNNHPAYREIIKLGPDVVPYLLQDLEDNHTHWFCALREITGVDPVPSTTEGDIPKVIEARSHWAKEHGYQL
jgi:hypothetical protein